MPGLAHTFGSLWSSHPAVLVLTWLTFLTSNRQVHVFIVFADLFALPSILCGHFTLRALRAATLLCGNFPVCADSIDAILTVTRHSGIIRARYALSFFSYNFIFRALFKNAASPIKRYYLVIWAWTT